MFYAILQSFGSIGSTDMTLLVKMCDVSKEGVNDLLLQSYGAICTKIIL